MASKIAFAASVTTTAVVAFGIGALAYSGPNESPSAAAPTTRPSVSTPDTTSPQLPDDVTPTPTETVFVPRPVALPRSVPQHAKPTASPEKPAQKRHTPKHAKPAKPKHAKPRAGDLGPLKDAEGDGKVLDDVVGTLLPDFAMPFSAPAGNTAIAALCAEPTEEPAAAFAVMPLDAPTTDPTSEPAPTAIPQ
jgi:hypothetical protein